MTTMTLHSPFKFDDRNRHQHIFAIIKVVVVGKKTNKLLHVIEMDDWKQCSTVQTEAKMNLLILSLVPVESFDGHI